jgi:hypothetical protein
MQGYGFALKSCPEMREQGQSPTHTESNWVFSTTVLAAAALVA